MTQLSPTPLTDALERKYSIPLRPEGPVMAHARSLERSLAAAEARIAEYVRAVGDPQYVIERIAELETRLAKLVKALKSAPCTCPPQTPKVYHDLVEEPGTSSTAVRLVKRTVAPRKCARCAALTEQQPKEQT